MNIIRIDYRLNRTRNMWLRKIPMRRYFLLRLIVGLILAGILEASEEPRETKVIFKETSSTITDRYSIHENTTPASLPVTNSSRELTSPIVIEARHRNDSNVFRPSQHLGEIEQPAVRPNPFNNVQHVRFENNVHLDTQRERFQNILQDTYLQSPGHGVSSLLDEATRSSRIKFEDDRVTQTSNVRHSFGDRQTVTESPRSQFEEAVGHAFVDQTFFQNVEKPEVQDTSAIFGKPTTDHRLTGVYYDASRSPYVISYHQTQNAYQPTSQETAIEMIKKPENNGILVLEEQSTYTRKRKFPYPFYQSGGDYHDMQYIEDPHPTMVYPRMKRPFPWKKIIHLIGTFLPLGLLLATLTPNVIRVGNTTATQPNIVLSKLRAVDLPVEHKQAPTLDDQSTVCEDRSVCELILAGGELKSNILQNILWNLAARTPDDVAKRNGLREVFSAVRKKDCTAISC